MRIPVTESRRGLETGSVRSVRVNDSVGSALRSVGGQLSSLGAHYQQQHEATQSLQARQSFIELQNTLQQDYRSTLQNAPETGDGVYEGWFSQDQANPGLFSQRSEEFIASLPESQQEEYRLRVTQLGGQYEDDVARDELSLRQTFAGSVIEQQVDSSVAAIAQNPELLDGQISEVTDLISQSGLSRAQRDVAIRGAEQTLTRSAIEAQITQDPAGMQRRISSHLEGLGSAQGGTNEQQLVSSALRIEAEHGIPARDLLSIISFETAGSLDPWQRGPTTQWGEHRGLIQWGEPQRRQYGVTQDSTVAEQMDAVARYLVDRGYRPGMQLENMYAAVLAGDANRTGVGDLHNGGVARSAAHAVQTQFGGHTATADRLLGQYGAVSQTTEGGGSGQIDPLLARVPPAMVVHLQTFAQGAIDDQAREVSQQNAVLKENFDLRIATGDEALTMEEILSSPLDDGQKATLVRSFRSARSDQMTAREFGQRMEFGDTFDPYSTDDRNGVSLAYDANVRGESALQDERAQAVLMDTVQRSGIVPETAFNELRRVTQSTDPQEVAQAGAVAHAIYSREGGAGQTAITSRSGGGDVERMAVQYRHYTENLGYSHEQAGEIMASLRDPETQQRRELLLESAPVREAISEIDEDVLLNVFDEGIFDIGPSQLGDTPLAGVAIQGEYLSIFREEIVAAQGDTDLAKELTNNRMRAMYGASQMTLAGDGVVTRYPPEVAYPAVGGNHDYIETQLAEATAEAGIEGDVRLQAVSETEAAVRQGQPAPYQVWFQRDGTWELYPHHFVASYDAANQQWMESQAEQQADSLQESGARWEELRGRMDRPITMTLDTPQAVIRRQQEAAATGGVQ